MDLYEWMKQNKRNVTPKQLIRLLESYGFVYRSSTGDHDFYKREGFRRFPVPVGQNPLAIHIVQAALRMIEEIRENDES